MQQHYKRKNSSSQYLGVSKGKKQKKWHAVISVNGVTYQLGYFTSELDAASAYNMKSVELLGDKAVLNIF